MAAIVACQGGRPAHAGAPGNGATPSPSPPAKPSKAKQRRERRKQQQQRTQRRPEPAPDQQSAPPRQQLGLQAAAPGGGGGGGGGELGCPHFGDCSGCRISHGVHRPPILEQARSFFAAQGITPFQLSVGSVHGWRQRARLAVRAGPGGQPVVGLFRDGTHDAVPIPGCVVHHPAINAAVELLLHCMRACGTAPFDEDSCRGDLRYVQLTVVSGSSSGGGSSIGGGSSSGDSSSTSPAHPAGEGQEGLVQLALVWHAEDEAGVRPAPASHASSLRHLAAQLWQAGRQQRHGGRPLLHSVWVNFQGGSTNVILGPSWALLHGQELAWARLGQADICFAPGSFLQANYEAMSACLSAIAEHVPPGARVADLHAGVGTIGLALAAGGCRPASVRCVELNQLAEPPFRRSAARLLQQLAAKQQQQQQYQQQQQQHEQQHDEQQQGAQERQHQHRSAAGANPTATPPVLEFHVAPAGSDPGRWCAEAEVLTVDPPRKGLDSELLGYLCSGEPPPTLSRLLYLSCGFPALVRDCGALLASGRWRLRHSEAFLFFPGADHIETLAVFERRQALAPEEAPP